MLDITQKNLPQIYSHIITKADIETLSEDLKNKIFESSNGISELVSIAALKFLIESLDKKLRANITLSDNKTVMGRITIEKSVSPTILNLEEDSEYCKLKAVLDQRTETLKLQYKLNSKHQIDNPGKDFIGIVESSGEQVPVISKKEGTGKEIIKITIPK